MGKMSRPMVLVVEDEPLILMDALEMITMAGFHALGASNADEALGILESRDDIGLIFTDVEMPGSIDGLKLAHAARRRWPPIEIVVASATHFRCDQDLPERGLFLRKPYSEKQLTQMLRALAA